MDLRRCHGPIPGSAGRQHHLRHQIAPDQRLRVGGNQEILLGLCQRIGKADQRTDQTSAGIIRPAAFIAQSIVPAAVSSLHTDKIVAAHEQGIGQKDLRSGRGVVHIVVADDGVAQSGRELSTHVFEALGIFRGLIDESAQVELPFVFHVLIDIETEGECILFRARHGIARELNIGDPGCEARGQLSVQLAAFGDAVQVVGKVEKQIGRKQLLRLDNALFFLRHFEASFGIVEGGSAG